MTGQRCSGGCGAVHPTGDVVQWRCEACRQATRSRRRYEAARAEQVCAWCPTDVPSGRSLCTACARKNAARRLARYHERKAS